MKKKKFRRKISRIVMDEVSKGLVRIEDNVNEKGLHISVAQMEIEFSIRVGKSRVKSKVNIILKPKGGE